MHAQMQRDVLKWLDANRLSNNFDHIDDNYQKKTMAKSTIHKQQKILLFTLFYSLSFPKSDQHATYLQNGLTGQLHRLG